MDWRRQRDPPCPVGGSEKQCPREEQRYACTCHTCRHKLSINFGGLLFKVDRAPQDARGLWEAAETALSRAQKCPQLNVRTQLSKKREEPKVPTQTFPGARQLSLPTDRPPHSESAIVAQIRWATPAASLLVKAEALSQRKLSMNFKVDKAMLSFHVEACLFKLDGFYAIEAAALNARMTSSPASPGSSSKRWMHSWNDSIRSPAWQSRHA